ncbi:hypothetical protein, partial [Salmonella enterica]|uniref:hypothetical protein n=1 Tax=Salmonella enterica TaxID=28901 RepID=UPI0011BEC03D
MTANKLDKLASCMFLRQHFLQTIIYTLTEDGSISDEHTVFLNKIIEVFTQNYPSIHQSGGSAARDDFKILDMAIANTLTLAITTVLELWIPPWTTIPQIDPNSTVGVYLAKLNIARLKALSEMSLASLVVEIIA